VPADSSTRKFMKRLLRPLMNDRSYQVLQSFAKMWDIRSGSWSEPEFGILPYAVARGDTVIDIGANFGLYCYHLSRTVGRSGRVHAFEPVPFTYGTARLVTRWLGLTNCTLYPKGCGEEGGRISFRVPVQNSGAISAGQAHLAARYDERDGKEIYSPFERSREVICDVVRLDAFLPGTERISFIKSDIEGADLLALRGASRLIEQHHPTILCEIKKWFLDGFGIEPKEFEEFFAPRGYGMYVFELLNGRRRLCSTSIKELGSHGTDNYVFIHESRADSFSPLYA